MRADTNRRRIIFFIAIYLCIGGCERPSRDALYYRGIELMGKSNFKGAVVMFKNSLEKDQNFTEARFHLAKSYINLKKLSLAEKEFKIVLDQDPNYHDAKIELAKIYLLQRRPEDALDEIGFDENRNYDNIDILEVAGRAYAMKQEHEIALKLLNRGHSLGEGDNLIDISLAEIHLQMGSADKARAHIIGVIDRDPTELNALNILARIQIVEKEYDNALQTYSLIVKENPYDYETWFRMGLLNIQQGQYGEAISISDAIIEAFPDTHQGYYLKGLAQFHDRNYDDAITSLQLAQKIFPDSNTYYYLGQCYYHQDKLESAISYFYKSLDLSPSMLQPRRMLSLIFLKQKRSDDAINEIRHVISQKEDDALSYLILGGAYAAKRKYLEGLREFKRAIELNPSVVDAALKKGLIKLNNRTDITGLSLNMDKILKPEVLDWKIFLAYYYLDIGQYDNSLDLLQSGITGARNDYIYYCLAADVLLRKNEINAAILMLDKAKNANPEFIELYLALSKLYFLAGDYDSGIEELRAIIERSQENIDALTGLALMFEFKGRYDEALRFYELARKTGGINGHVALAKYLFRTNDFEGGMDVINKAIESNPDSALLYELKGKALISKNEYADALETFEELEKIDPVSGYRNIRDCYLLMNSPQEALDKAEEELNKNNQRLDVMADVSSIYSAMGDRENAILNANKIIRTDPYSSLGYKILAQVYLENREYQNAENVLDEAEKVSEDDTDISLMKGKLFRLKNDHASALKVYNDALGITPGHISLIFNKGATFHEMGRINEAISEYMKTLSISSNHVSALNNLAYIYADTDRNPTRALYLALKAYLLSPFDAAVQDTLGLAMIKNNLFDDALTLLSKAKNRNPKNPAIHYHSALAHKARNEKTKAIEELRIAVELGNFTDSVKAEELLISLLKE